MRKERNRFFIYCTVALAVLLGAACELEEDGNGDTGDMGGDVGTCVADDWCDPACAAGVDPDCECACDRADNVCNANADDSAADCTCDPDCTTTAHACVNDAYCDPWCPPPSGTGECDCDYYENVCEAGARESTDLCPCDVDCDSMDPDCSGACVADTHCDTWCPDDEDPDCEETCGCDYFNGICEPEVDGSDRACACDEDCSGGEDPCQADDHCDNWCDPGGICKDIDCQGTEGSGYGTGECNRT
ncbi:MAG: hypothetical protein JW797_09615 [Bradymonadales bacterium]|nr:hypothetical protein [Bradymonadales bacterium]